MIREIFFENAGPFRGKHRIELGAKTYALTARYEADPGRSNWGGKSFLLELVNFALTGSWPKNRRAQWGGAAADGWITRGEREANVGLVLEDGACIMRTKVRGQSAQVRFSTGDAAPASQAEAEAAVMKHLGFSDEDFLNIAYMEQKQIARFVTTEPEKRLDIVRGWFGLEKAERAEDAAGDIAAEHVQRLTALRERRNALTAIGDVPVFDFAKAEAELAAKRAAVKEANKAIHDLEQAIGSVGADRDLVKRYNEIVDRGKALAAEVGAEPPGLADKAKDAQTRMEELKASHIAAERDCEAKRKVSLGLFNGKCPVADIECPATKKINADRSASKTAYEAARVRELAADVAVREARPGVRDALVAWEAAKKKREELETLRRETAPIVEKVKEARVRLKTAAKIPNAGSMVEAQERLGEADDAVHLIHTEIATAKAAKENHDRQMAEAAKLTEEIDVLSRKVAIALRARGIIRAAQRKVVEGALAEINRRATQMLSDANVDLSVELRWEREGGGPAKQCEECGAAFPASRTVKICPGCGAARGKLIVQRLEFVPSDRSGAADDIAGVALVLAAGAWFLSSRASPWATAMLDEPLGACDRTNRRALSLELTKLLATGAWRQAIVISHNPDTVDLYPGKIEVVVRADGSRHIHVV